MSGMPAFSRLQLAAALIEYDNDPDNPRAPRRDAKDSAIFAHLRRANGNIYARQPEARSQDFLGVKLPSDSGAFSDTGREKSLGSEQRRKSKLSIDMLQNPFGGEAEEEGEEAKEESDLEVDLESWGLGSIMPEDKASKKAKKGKGKAKSEIVANTVGVGPRPAKEGRSPQHGRTMSMPLGEFGEGGLLEARERRNTISDPLSLNEMGVLGDATDSRKFSSHPLIEDMQARRPLSAFERTTVPFPRDVNASEFNLSGGTRPESRMSSMLDAKSSQFMIPPPPPSRASRFDPKYAAHVRAVSNATQLSTGTHTGLPYLNDDGEENENVMRAPSRASALDMKSMRERRVSTFSMRTQDMLNDDYQYEDPVEEMSPRERRYSRLDLMRPKLLVMPSPLQNTAAPPPSAPKAPPRGFIDSSDGRPLPAAARSRTSVIGPSLSANVPVPSNSFTPNPRLNLSTSQLLFRNNLKVDGQRDITYNDIDGGLKRATEDGIQAKLEFPDRPILPEVQVVDLPPEEPTISRPPGKLYGRSLIDDLEARKVEMKNKKRVFTGDQRPSMMDRALTRSSTLIDPAILPSRPTSMLMPTSQSESTLSRSGSKGKGPLLAMDSSGNIAEAAGVRQSRLANTRSVFGVDTLWAREMSKLKEIEEQERLEAEEEEERKRREELEFMEGEGTKKRKGKKKGKKGGVEDSKSTESLATPTDPVSPSSAPSATSPVQEIPTSLTLPTIPTVSTRRRSVPVPDDDESDGESSASEVDVKDTSIEKDRLADKWISDDEKPAPPASASVPRINVPDDDSDDEEIPLSLAIQKAALRKSMLPQADDDSSDEDRPLSMLLLNKTEAGSTSPNLADLVNFDSKPSLSLPKNSNEEDDEDNEPLGIRASRLPAGASQLSFPSSLSQGVASGGGDDEDDRPLSMHPTQIRKSQFNILAQFQQQQQQQQLYQAQMASQMSFPNTQSMMFMMPPGPFTPQPQMQMPMAVPPPESNKFSSVDRWRRDVAVEGPP